MQAVFAYGYILAAVYFLLFLVLYWFREASRDLLPAYEEQGYTEERQVNMEGGDVRQLQVAKHQSLQARFVTFSTNWV
jgi:hypothetical protein